MTEHLPESTTDISHITDVVLLKSMAYDQLAAVEQGQRNLQIINQRIQQLSTTVPTMDEKELNGKVAQLK